MKKIFLFVCVKCHLTCLTAAIHIWSNRARRSFVDFLTNLTNLTAKNQKSSIYIFYICVHIVIFIGQIGQIGQKMRFSAVLLCLVHWSNFCVLVKNRGCVRGSLVKLRWCCLFVSNCYKLDERLFCQPCACHRCGRVC